MVGILQRINLNPKTEQSKLRTVERIFEIEKLVFGGKIDENIADVMKAISEFSTGYPMAPVRSHGDGGALFSFEYDLNAIIIAIRNQSGIDLTYRCKHFHWWLFLLEFHTLCGDHYILNMMEARGYKGKDSTLRRRRDACALPPVFTDEELEEYEELNAQFK